jgi:hypothetical protein
MIEKLPFDLVPLLIDTTVHTHCSLLKKYICNNKNVSSFFLSSLVDTIPQFYDPAIFNG